MTQEGLIGAISEHAKHAVICGTVMVIAGVLAIMAPFVTGLSLMVVLGVLLLVAGIAECLLAFKAGAFGRGLLIFVIGLLTAIAGLWTLLQPLAALATVTLLLAAYFVVAGVVELFAALSGAPAAGRGWLIFGAVVSIILGVLLWRQFPLSGVWAVGTLVGIRLLLSGMSLIGIGSAARKGIKNVAAAQ
jgi:uncharacterized membrane protein HdeD (DUF308 family)